MEVLEESHLVAKDREFLKRSSLVIHFWRE